MNYFNKIVFLSLTLGLSANSLAWTMEEAPQAQAPAATEPEAEIDQFGIDQSGWTSLHKAVFNRNFERVLYSLNHRSDPNAVAFTNGPISMLTPLLIAARIGSEAMVELLLSQGANINYAPGETTALHLAAYYGHDQVVDLLLEHNANAKLKTGANFMAFELAIQRGHQEAAQKLMSAATFATDRCLMCFDELHENYKVVRLSCGHIYKHENCDDPKLENDTHNGIGFVSDLCPTCGTQIDWDKLYRLTVTEEFLARARS